LRVDERGKERNKEKRRRGFLAKCMCKTRRKRRRRRAVTPLVDPLSIRRHNITHPHTVVMGNGSSFPPQFLLLLFLFTALKAYIFILYIAD